MFEWTLVSVPFDLDWLNPRKRTHQINAIRSWNLLRPRPEIILLGRPTGFVDLRLEVDLSLDSVPFELNKFGHISMGGVFRRIDQISPTDVICYVDADVILLPEVPEVLEYVTTCYDSFCTCSGRWEATIDHLVEFKDPDWPTGVAGLVDKLHPRGSDYCMYKRGMFSDMPDFSIGKGYWDGWRMGMGKQRGTLVNIERACKAVHQRHGIDWSGHPATGYNQRLAKGKEAYVRDSDVWVERGEVERWSRS